MSKPKPTTKEQLVYFLHTNISLGTYDKKFIENLISNYIATLRPVTTNQDALLDKVTLRYERQLRKDEVDANEMVNLQWNVKPIESLPNFTEAFVETNDDIIEVRTPFKSEFIKELKTLRTAEWHRETKVWTIAFSELNLKNTVKMVEKYFSKINYCDDVKDALNIVSRFEEGLYWNPTLVNSNGYFYVASVNESLYNAIKDINLDDSLPTLALLSYYGVDISRHVINALPVSITNAQVDFALDREPTLETEPEEIHSKLTMIGVDYVMLRERSSGDKKFSAELIKLLTADNIVVDVLDSATVPNLRNLEKYKMPVLLGGYSLTTSIGSVFAKHIGLVNSKPINIK